MYQNLQIDAGQFNVKRNKYSTLFYANLGQSLGCPQNNSLSKRVSNV